MPAGPDLNSTERLWNCPVSLGGVLEVAAGAKNDSDLGAAMLHLRRSPVAAPSTRILAPIPAERRRVALRNYHDKSGRIVHEGSVWDAHDEFVKANADMFGPDEAA